MTLSKNSNFPDAGGMALQAASPWSADLDAKTTSPLTDTPVLLAANGGSERHALVIDHQLRPLFSFFQARTLPLGVYATDKDFVDRRLSDEAVIERARLAVQRALPVLDVTQRSISSNSERSLAV